MAEWEADDKTDLTLYRYIHCWKEALQLWQLSSLYLLSTVPSKVLQKGKLRLTESCDWLKGTALH